MPHIYQCTLTLLEPTFFSSREVSNTYLTEPFIGNYALAYALGLVQAPYFNQGEIHYGEHLAELNRQGVYITPATLLDAPRFQFRQFNAQADAYWFAFARNIIITRPDGADVKKSDRRWAIFKNGQRIGFLNPENRPQHGRIRFLSIGNRAQFFLISKESIALQRYIRLGKFMSKARLDATETRGDLVQQRQQHVSFLLNPADLPSDMQLHTFDLLNVPPMPLIHHATLSGQFYALPHKTYLPAGMRFGVPSP